MIQFEDHIFQMGWNHQLVTYSPENERLQTWKWGPLGKDKHLDTNHQFLGSMLVFGGVPCDIGWAIMVAIGMIRIF